MKEVKRMKTGETMLKVYVKDVYKSQSLDGKKNRSDKKYGDRMGRKV